MAEDGLEVPPAPDDYGPRRLVRYRRDFLDRLRGAAPDEEMQGAPEVPTVEAPAAIRTLQERFAQLASMGSIETEDLETEFLRLIAQDGATVPYQQEKWLDEVRSQIMGESSAAAERPDIDINPAHLSWMSNADIRSSGYDETMLGPVVTSLDLSVLPVTAEPEPATESPQLGEPEEPEKPAESENPAESERPAEAPSPDEDAQSGEPEGDADRTEAFSSSGDHPWSSDATVGVGEDSSSGRALAGSTSTDSRETQDSSSQAPAHHAPDDPSHQSHEVARDGYSSEAAPDARPVRAVDAHGLDLSGMDEKAPGSGGRGILIFLLVLLVIIAVVLGLIAFL